MTFTIPAGSFNPPPGYEEEYRSVASEAMNLCDGMVLVTVVPKPRGRTVKENSYLHLLIKRMASVSGIGLDSVKEYVKSRAVAIGYPPKTDEKGGPIRTEGGDVLGKDSHLATVEECALLIEACHIVAGEWGFTLED
jgi:hypothetical protein